MAKSALAGEMRTRIVVKSLTVGIDEDGYPVERWDPIFTEPVRCLWQNAHGNEAYEAMRLDLKEAATLTMRYTPKIDVRCRIWRLPEDPEDETKAFEIVSLDAVEQRGAFLELKVRRTVTA